MADPLPRMQDTRTLCGLLAVLALAIGLLSLLAGSAPIAPGAVLGALTGRGDPVAIAIVTAIRLPRALLGLLVGGVLGLSGAALQGFLRNPLAEPATLGISNSAALGGVIALYFGFAAASSWALPVFAIAAALAAMAILSALSHWSDGTHTIILGGIALATLAGAGIALALNLSSDPFAITEITFWLMGSVEDRSMDQVLLVLPFALAGAALLLWQGGMLDALTLGEDTARSLGFDMRRGAMLVMAGVALGVGASVAVSGAIGFVGLMVPHMLRPFVGSRPSKLLIPSALAGAAMLTAADILVRLIPTQNTLGLGVVTAFLGTPVFLHLLLRARRMA